MKKFLILIGTIILLGMGCKQSEWQGFYYPNGCLSCMEDYVYSPALTSLQECRSWANAIRIERGNNPNDQYECGKNCRAKGVLRVCEETVD